MGTSDTLSVSSPAYSHVAVHPLRSNVRVAATSMRARVACLSSLATERPSGMRRSTVGRATLPSSTRLESSSATASSSSSRASGVPSAARNKAVCVAGTYLSSFAREAFAARASATSTTAGSAPWAAFVATYPRVWSATSTSASSDSPNARSAERSASFTTRNTSRRMTASSEKTSSTWSESMSDAVTSSTISSTASSSASSPKVLVTSLSTIPGGGMRPMIVASVSFILSLSSRTRAGLPPLLRSTCPRWSSTSMIF